MLKPGMYRIATSITQNREPQLPHASRNTNPHVSKSTRVNHTFSVSRPQLKTSNVNAVYAECGKCVFNSNHDACVSKYLNDVNARTKKPKVVPISASKLKRKTNKSVATLHKKTVASDTTIQKPKSYFKELYENTNKAWKWWIEKKCPSEYKWTQTTPSRPSLKCKPTDIIFSNVRLRWIPTGKSLNSCTCKVDSEPTHGSIVDILHIYGCKQTLGLSAEVFKVIRMVRLGINPMIQPEPEDLPKDNPKLEIAVLSEVKILANASREKLKTYTRRRSTDSSKDSTAGGLFSTAEEVQGKEQISTDKKEMARAAARVYKQRGLRCSTSRFY
ncbi:hypothetical protein Tco_0963526 [Tanacetum coccineum]